MDQKPSQKEKAPWSARRIVALLGIIVLLGLYASTLVFALMKSPAAKGLLMASIYCTIVVPILLFAMMYIAKALRGRGVAENEKAPEAPSLHEKATGPIHGDHVPESSSSHKAGNDS